MDNLRDILEQARAVIDFNDTSFHDQESMQYQRGGPPFYPVRSFHTDTKATSHEVTKSAKKRTWKKPKDKPKRPLSAYNIFFQQERKEIIALLPEDNTVRNDGLTEEQRRSKHRKTHGKIGFADLARVIADKWKLLDVADKGAFESRANAEKERYRSELDAWKRTQAVGIKTSKPMKKKKKAVPPKSRRASVTPESLDAFTMGEDAEPEALSSMLINSFEANRTIILQLMHNSQFLADLQQQTPDDAIPHDFRASNRLTQIHQYPSQFHFPRSTHGPNCGAPMNYPQFVPDTCRMPCDSRMGLDYQYPVPQSNPLLDEIVFQDIADASIPEALPDCTSELLLEKSLDAFIDNFEADVQQD